MLNDTSSALALLATRRSGKPKEMVAPGPDAAELDTILAAAMRVPDHGKLAPWRFVIVPAERRDALAALLEDAYRAESPRAGEAEVRGAGDFARQAPVLVVALASPDPAHKVPVWEQQLSVGAACMNLLLAVHALGYVGGWLTGWAAYAEAVRDAFGAAPERIAGFLFLGTAGKAPEERPRPDPARIVSTWNAPGLDVAAE